MTDQRRGPVAATLFDVRTDEQDGVTVVSLIGELDMNSADRAADALHTAVAQARAVVVNMTDVTFFASAGMNVLLLLGTHLQSRGVVMRLVADQSAVLRPLKLMGVTDQFLIHTTLVDALEAARPR